MRGDFRDKLSPFIQVDLGFNLDHLCGIFLTIVVGTSVCSMLFVLRKRRHKSRVIAPLAKLEVDKLLFRLDLIELRG